MAVSPGPGGAKFCCSTGTGACCTEVKDSSGTYVLGLPGVGIGVSSSGDFASNFLQSASSYEVPFPDFQTGASGAGDWNARYSAMYYSMTSTISGSTNMTAWEQTCGTGTTGGCSGVTPSGQYFCPVELAIAGTYPNARYFSLANYDEHYTNAQHIADFDIDAAATADTNPFLPPNDWAAATYVVPVSMGTVPGGLGGGNSTLSGCQITPAEQDNLLDGTQRHPAADWNTDVLGAPGTNFPPESHNADNPEHGNPSPAGSIHVRAYLSPKYACTGSVGSSLSCTLPSGSYFPNGSNVYTYFLVRDTYTGCAYTANYVSGEGNILATGTSTPVAPQFMAESTNWQDTTQMSYHLAATAWTPQLCYANGAPSVSAPFANMLAWTRTANHVAGQAPDDAYLSAPISTAVLQNVISGAACSYPSDGNGCAIRLRFKVPPMPNMPCASGTSCPLPSASDLRYESLTFGYMPSSGGATSMLADIDGENPAVTGPDSYSIVSLADPAFTAAENANYYVTLIVNVNPNVTLPVGIAYGPGTSGGYTVASAPILQGAGPVQPLTNYLEPPQTQLHYYTAWVNTFSGGSADPYLVLDLTQFGDFWDTSSTTKPDPYSACSLNSTGAVVCTSPLILTLRSTMLGNDFTCSAFSVPYNAAEYTNYASSDGYSGGGFMGPYVPLVDYIAVGALTEAAQNGGCGTPGYAACPDALPPPPALQAGDLPSQGSCRQFPVSATGQSIFPLGNGASSSIQALFPVQYWPNTNPNGSGTQPPQLNCSSAGSGSAAFTPQMDFSATEFTTQAMISTEPGYGTPSPCSYEDTLSGGANSNPCIQVIKQEVQDSSQYQPPLPLTIVGAGFGYLSGLPWAGTSPPNVVVSDDDASHGGLNPWSTNGATGSLGNCQVYISDWTDSTISLLVGLPQSIENGAHTVLSPLTDMSPSSFFQVAPASTCPVARLDNINVTVTNPQQSANPPARWRRQPAS